MPESSATRNLPSEQATSGPDRRSRLLRVLLLEDVASDAELVSLELRSAGIAHVLRRVETPEAFLKELDEFRPGLILADYSLPTMTAIDALHLLAGRRRRPPFILVTGTHTEEIAVECMKMGADDYILKESLKRLPSAVANTLRSHEINHERKRAERALKRSERRYRLIAENTRDLICVLDPSGSLLYVSPSSSALIGYNPEELVGQRAGDYVHSDDRPFVARAFRAALADGQSRTTELRWRHRSGEWVALESVGGWVATGSRRRPQAVVVFRDVTERKRSEEQLRQANLDLQARERELLQALEDLRSSHQKLRSAHLQLIQAEKLESVGRLAAGIAHEVKNPLNVILMGVEYMSARLGSEDDDVNSVLKDMEEAVMRADTVIRGLLDFSAPGRLNLQVADVNRIVEESLLLMKHEFSRGRVNVVRDLAPGLPMLSIDRHKLGQVFINLFLNAVQAMAGEGTLRVTSARRCLADCGDFVLPDTEHLAPDRSIVLVTVEDSGSGVPPQMLGKVFDPFFTTKPPGQGTGLGLTVILEIMRMHRGAVRIDNRPEGGARALLAFEIEQDG